jgi:hypothetical protein
MSGSPSSARDNSNMAPFETGGTSGALSRQTERVEERSAIVLLELVPDNEVISHGRPRTVAPYGADLRSAVKQCQAEARSKQDQPVGRGK